MISKNRLSLPCTTSHCDFCSLNSSSSLLNYPRCSFQRPGVWLSHLRSQRIEPQRAPGTQHWQRATIGTGLPQRTPTRSMPRGSRAKQAGQPLRQQTSRATCAIATWESHRHRTTTHNWYVHPAKLVGPTTTPEYLEVGTVI